MLNHKKAQEIIQNINQFLIGKNEIVELSVITLLAGGHLLLEDVPGVGKTTLANVLAASVGCGFSRIQFTPDTLPGDVLGASIYNMKTGEFSYVPGAIVNHIVLVDEINRTSPKTQAALLEAMEERQVTVDKVTYPLEEPFFVIATQNPVEFVGTYHLPEAQLDRFLMKLSIGYPNLTDEHKMSVQFIEGKNSAQATSVVERQELLLMQEEVQQITVSDKMVEYIVKLIAATRESELLVLGGSPRATLGLISAGRSCAYVSGRDYVIPDDVQRVLPHVLCHRIMLTVDARMNQKTPEKIIADIQSRIRVPI